MSEGRSRSRPWLRLLLLAALAVPLGSCGSGPAPDTVVMIIESSPANLDPRVGTDAQSERIYKLMFDALLVRDEHFNLKPGLADSWEIPDPLTYIFRLRHDVRFQDGRPLLARDVKWTFDSVRDGTVITPKASTFRSIDFIEAPDEYTVIFHLKEPFSTLPWNVSDGAIGIVPYGSGRGFNTHPIGSGPFRLVSLEQDKDVVLQRNSEYWGRSPKIERVEFHIVPDSTTRALELRKGSADIALTSLTADMIETLKKSSGLVVEESPGTVYSYLAMNLRDPILSDVRVRQALAYAIDRRPMIHYLWRDEVRLAASILPPQHWAYNAAVATYEHKPEEARKLLDQAGHPPGPDGIRFHLTMKTSNEESTRLFAAVLQQQLREVGIALDIRTFEFATFYADVQKGAFQLFSMRWVGGNEDPDIFEHVFYSTSTPPRRANRGYYANPRVDALIDAGRRELSQDRRRQIYGEVQRILAADLPYINLWYYDNVVVHSRRLKDIKVSPSGNYDFLCTAELGR